jgi:hypothetical protein
MRHLRVGCRVESKPVRHEGFESSAACAISGASVDFKLYPRPIGAAERQDQRRQDYPDFMLGARWTAKLTDRWALTLRGDGSWGQHGRHVWRRRGVYLRDEQWCVGTRLPLPEAEVQRRRPRFNVKMYGPEFGYSFKF